MKALLKPKIFFLSFLFIISSGVFSQSYQWAWMKGDNTINQPGAYGTMGVPSVANKPAARGEAVSWKDNDGNFWFFGGIGLGLYTIPAPLADLWKYKVSTNEWTWVKGSRQPSVSPVYGTRGTAAVNNTPGGRKMSASWTDTNGNLWLFGGSSSALLNDLWKYDIVSNQWTWMNGDNTGNVHGQYGVQAVSSATNKPGARTNAVCWADKTGNLWLFGGNGYAASGTSDRLGDLWKYNISSNEWTWMKGDSVIQSLSVYGEKGVSSVSNKPGARIGSSSWIDGADNLWLFAGLGYASGYGLLNDLWKYSTSTNEWVWQNGDSTAGHPSVYNNASLINSVARPGGIHNAITNTTGVADVWLFGGRGYTATAFGELNALWKYNMNSNQWSFVKGDPAPYVAGEYGAMGVPAETNKPGSREKLVAWTDSLGNLWMFGGENYPLNTTTTFYHNDLWKLSWVSILPVKLISFNGKLKDNDVSLKWTVENEVAFNHYEIQRSINGTTFQSIGKVKAMNRNSYDYVDLDASQPGILYYRLKMVDIDGNSSYSNIINFKIEQTIPITLYPNPARDFTHVKLDRNVDSAVVVQIMNTEAGLIRTDNYNLQGNGFVISTKELPNGIYFVKIIFGGRSFVESLSVVK